MPAERAELWQVHELLNVGSGTHFIFKQFKYISNKNLPKCFVELLRFSFRLCWCSTGSLVCCGSLTTLCYTSSLAGTDLIRGVYKYCSCIVVLLWLSLLSPLGYCWRTPSPLAIGSSSPCFVLSMKRHLNRLSNNMKRYSRLHQLQLNIQISHLI